ncbi:LacI family DNA-binding transcriptional regulator [Streptomyces sp. JV176]|uniref:LacI family DNA-binding transcriptional regulator n=1 Tax=Streptomyces sp. JV176 TaxID=858630 RepID=UPI002E77F08C|nr:LacI family DNA-binding transcriptional regulator [Streptomyces sp. JV176]MEE1800693.1 LacI family DNA-binding transcriptional regulator [Streptomyces sp. JV176]
MDRPAKRATSADVARVAGVSRTTVSFVLNDKPGQTIPEETRRRVLEAARSLEYHPHSSARALAAGRSEIVLLSLPAMPIGAGISRFIEELATALAEHGLTLVTHLSGARGRPLPEVCAIVNASAVVGFESFDPATIRALYSAGAQFVFPFRMDHAHGMRPVGRLQAEYLIGRGHRRLGYAMPDNRGLRPMAEDRLLGVADACAAAGIAPPVVASTNLEIAPAARAVAEWTARSVTGVCAFNDDTAIAVLAGMREHGLAAPADLAVIGVDDTPTARLAAPPLTTVSFALHEVSRRRAEVIVEGLAGRETQSASETINPLLVERSTT